LLIQQKNIKLFNNSQLRASRVTSELSRPSSRTDGMIAKSTSNSGSYRLFGGIGYSPCSVRGFTFTLDAPVLLWLRPPTMDQRLLPKLGSHMARGCPNGAQIATSDRLDAGDAQYGHHVGSQAKFSQETIAYLKSGNLSGRGGHCVHPHSFL
jgi:hypothetical protein